MIRLISYTARSDGGFSLVEVMIALMMSTIIAVSLYNTSKTQQDSYVSQNQVVEMQQNLRAALLLLSRELRLAGYDPTSQANAGFTSAAVDSVTFTMDLNEDGDVNDSDETITYNLYTSDGIQKLGRRNPTQNMPVAEHIANLEFYYRLENGTWTTAPANLADIRAIRISILAQASAKDPNFGASPSFTTPSGATWTLPAGYRGRLATITITCRNMGL